MLERQRLRLNGATFNIEVEGNGQTNDLPVMLLHGFSGNAASWQPVRSTLARHYRVIALDALGHGLSDAPPDPARYSLEGTVADFEALLDRLEIEKVALLGYSMGGRAALQIGLELPERLTHLVLESTSPGLAEEAARQERQRQDEALAARLEHDGMVAFVEYWESLPLWASQQQLPAAVRAAQHAARLQNRAQGLANSLRGAGTGTQPSLWEQLPSLTLPTLLIVGGLDLKFSEIARQMAQALPDSRLAIVPGAGHNVHLERPAEFSDLVTNFLGET